MPPKEAQSPAKPESMPAKKEVEATPAQGPEAQGREPPPKKEEKSQLVQVQVLKPMQTEITQQLTTLLKEQSASARSIVDFVVGPTCGLESRHNYGFSYVDMTPFLLAVCFNRLDVAQLLVAEHSVNTRPATKNNYTALHIASYEGYPELVRWLVELCGLDVNAVDVNSTSSLRSAIKNKRSEVALLLLELGADPNHPDAFRSTPLHLVCVHGLVDVARALLAKGASPASVNAQRKTPLDIAVELQNREMAALLEARPYPNKD